MGKGKRNRSKRVVRYSDLYEDGEDRDENDLDWEDQDQVGGEGERGMNEATTDKDNCT